MSARRTVWRQFLPLAWLRRTPGKRDCQPYRTLETSAMRIAHCTTPTSVLLHLQFARERAASDAFAPASAPVRLDLVYRSSQSTLRSAHATARAPGMSGGSPQRGRDYSARPRCRSAALAFMVGRVMVKGTLRGNYLLDQAGTPARQVRSLA